MNAPMVKTEVRGRVALLTLDRPKALNALSNEVIDELAEAMRGFDADDNELLVVWTRVGDAPEHLLLSLIDDEDAAKAPAANV